MDVPTDEETDALLSKWGHPAPEPRQVAPELDDFLNEPEPEYDWQVPGLLERGDRACFTGPEGGGKSTLLRQVAVQLASGVHPFTLEAIDPLRVLLVDFENGRRHVRRELRKLRAKAHDAYTGNLFVEVEVAGMDLFGHPADAEWLEERCALRKPDVLIIGPAYKMASGDENTMPVARAIQQPLDQLRGAYGFSVLMELHTGHATNGGRRPTRPVGSSAWLRWPEFGMHLADNGTLTTWRGPRDEREWPRALKRGGQWPWTTETDAREDELRPVQPARSHAHAAAGHHAGGEWPTPVYTRAVRRAPTR